MPAGERRERAFMKIHYQLFDNCFHGGIFISISKTNQSKFVFLSETNCKQGLFKCADLNFYLKFARLFDSFIA